MIFKFFFTYVHSLIYLQFTLFVFLTFILLHYEQLTGDLPS